MGKSKIHDTHALILFIKCLTLLVLFSQVSLRTSYIFSGPRNQSLEVIGTQEDAAGDFL